MVVEKKGVGVADEFSFAKLIDLPIGVIHHYKPTPTFDVKGVQPSYNFHN